MSMIKSVIQRIKELSLSYEKDCHFDIVAMADGEIIDVHSVSDMLFAQEKMGKTIAFTFTQDHVVLCSPANGTIKFIFSTGHAFGIKTNDGMELLVHCGIDTVNSNGKGFKILSKKQGDKVRVGDPIVKVDVKELSQKYDMSTMLIIVDSNGREVEFLEPQKIVKGQSIIKNYE